MTQNKTIKIGNAGGYWGDDLDALKQQLSGGHLDYITVDFLAEITMSILLKQHNKNPDLGYVTDFVDQINENIDLLLNKGVKIITNAGGINPKGCAKTILSKLAQKNKSIKIAIITGDNMIHRIEEFYPKHTNFENMETGEQFEPVKNNIQSANVYLGCAPIVEALKTGAQIILAGRVTDTSITMAPLMYEFGWQPTDFDKLASALVAGHIIECGAQASGGNFTDWHLIKNWKNFGYPIIEATENGDFVITKHPGTGGLISINSVKEQLVYEMGNPETYISPDVVANFLTIKLSDDGTDRVKITGVKGFPPTPFYKVSMAYADGYRANSSVIISGDKAIQKAEIFASLFWERLGISFEKSNHEFIGYNACHHHLAPQIEPNEILLRFNVFDYDKRKIDAFSKKLNTIILSGPQGVAVTGGRPNVREVMSYYPALIPKNLIVAKTELLNGLGETVFETFTTGLTGLEQMPPKALTPLQISDKNFEQYEHTNQSLVKIKLKKLCLARSGDKGDMANIGVIARNQQIFDELKKILTANLIKKWFYPVCKGNVLRYELDNIWALNFLLEQSLDGGGTKSLMIDAQGKTFAAALLNQEIEIPESIAKLVE